MHFLKHLRARVASPSQRIATPSPCPSRVTIGELPDKVLLDIFCYFLDGSPRYWPTLVHICRKWRGIVFASQETLHLRLVCTHGTPVRKTLDYWPATLPIIVRYGGSPGLDAPAPEDEYNITAALKQSHRVRSISLTVTSSLRERLFAISRPFSELEDLVLLSRESEHLILPISFRWGPRLRRLHSTRIAVLSLLQLLSSSKNLVDLKLHEVLNPWHLSPEALTNALSGMAQLQSLSLHFRSTDNHVIPPPSPWNPIALPFLTRFDFRGIIKYLEAFVSGIYAPRLKDIKLTFFNQVTMDLSQIHKFIYRIEMHKSHRRAHILSSQRGISISLMQPGTTIRLTFQFFGEPLRQQLFFLDGLCAQFSTGLSDVEDLRISTLRPPGRTGARTGGLDMDQWRDAIKSFAGVKRFHVAGNLSLDVMLVLQWFEIVLPALHELSISHPGPQNAHLREAVVSVMVSRRLSGHPIVVDYEQRSDISRIPGTGLFSQQVTTEVLSDDILLNIFRHTLAATPRFWPVLAWVCQRWRQIVLISPLGLNLRLYCTYGTPVLMSLDCWPPLPIIVEYGGIPNLDPPAPEDDDNIVAALKEFGRVNSIGLTVTSSLLEKIKMSAAEPFSELEQLSVLSGDNMQLTLPGTFRWGTRLRTLHTTRIAFLSLPQLLSPCHDLVDLQLHEIPSAGYFPPEAFANALSEMTHLRSLTLHLLSFPRRRSLLGLPPPSGERIVLPALTRLKYRGTSKYLDCLAARIDAPLLGEIDITFFSQPTMDATQLGRFIERVEKQTSLNEGELRTSADAISISFSNSSTSTSLQLKISCKQLDWQLSCMAQVCDQFSQFLIRVEELRIKTTQSPSGQDDVAAEQWLDLLRQFGGAGSLWVARGPCTADILCALGLVDGGNTTMLPALRHLHVENQMAMDGPSWDALLSFITSRSRFGCPVQVNVPFSQCNLCHLSFRMQKDLDLHLIDEHGYRTMCSYCADFECTPENGDLFREHLESEHPILTRSDQLISNPTLAPYRLDQLVKRHSSLRAPDIAPSPTTSAAPHPQ